MDTIIYDKIDEVQGKVEYNGGGINSLKQDTAALLAKGVVKSVQKGFFETKVRSNSEPSEVTININTIVPTKSVCLASAGLIEANSVGAGAVSLVKELNATNIKFWLKSTHQSGFEQDAVASWQVIEFY